MGYVDGNLVPGETVIYETRLHWVVMIGHIIFAVLDECAAVFLLVYAYRARNLDLQQVRMMQIAGLMLLVAGVIIFVVGWVRRNATEMAVTNHRVVIKTGIATRKTIEMMLSKVESIEVTEPAFGRLLGYGSIVVIGTGGTPEPFHKMAHPLEFRSQVQQEIEKLR